VHASNEEKDFDIEDSFYEEALIFSNISYSCILASKLVINILLKNILKTWP
jgi:hypothetical protein